MQAPQGHLWLKQAPCACFERIKSTLLQFCFKPSKCEPSLFIFTKQNKLFLLVYVNDIILTGKSDSLIHHLIKQLDVVFSLIHNLDYLLGIEVKSLPNGTTSLTQSKYFRALLAKTNMLEAKPIASPMTSTCKLSKQGNEPSVGSLFLQVCGRCSTVYHNKHT